MPAVGKKYNLKVAYNEAADKASWEEMITFLIKSLNKIENSDDYYYW